jgi:hypothetical protein
MSDAEVWKNVSKGTTWIRRYDRGVPIDEIVHPGGVVKITPEDRQFQMSQAANQELDIFQNGIMQPVKLIEDHEDTASIRSNPNMLGEGEISDLFDLHWKRFESQVSSITNIALLARVLEYAMEAPNTTVKQMNVIKDRINEIDPSLLVESGQVAKPLGKFEGATT